MYPAKLKGLLPRIYAGSNLDAGGVRGLINLFSTRRSISGPARFAPLSASHRSSRTGQFSSRSSNLPCREGCARSREADEPFSRTIHSNFGTQSDLI